MTVDLTRLILADHKAQSALDAARAAARGDILQAIEEVTHQVTGAVPLAEKLSWGPKEVAARAWVAGEAGAEQAALLAGEAAVTGEPEAALAARIIANADAYRAIVARLTGLRRRAEAALAAAATPQAVAEVRSATLAQLLSPPG